MGIRRIVGGVVLAGLVLVLLGCGPAGKRDDSTLVYWRTLTGGAGDAQDELVQRFNEGQETLRVLSEFQGGYGDLAAKLMTAAVSGVGPDVTQLGTFEIRQFAKSGALVDLRPYLDGPKGLDTSDWPGTMAEAGKIDGGIYWLPFNVTVPVLYYNVEAFEEAGLPGPPATWDDFFAYAARLTQRDDRGVVQRHGVALWNITWPLFSAIWSEGGELTSKDYGSITLDGPVVVEVLTAFQNLVREGAASLPDKASGGHRAAFINGQAAMILDSPAPFEEIMDSAVGFTPGTAMYPAGRAGRVYAPGGGGLAIMAITPEVRREGAWRFIRFMLAPEQIAYYARRSGYTAFTEASRASAGDLLADPRRAVMHEALPYLRGDFSVNMSPAIRRAFDEAFQRILIEFADVRQTLEKADAKAERDIGREL